MRQQILFANSNSLSVERQNPIDLRVTFAKLLKPRLRFEMPPSKEYEVSLSGISLTNVFRQLREILGISETKVVGGFVCNSTHCNVDDYRLELYISGSSPILLDKISSKFRFNDYISDAANKILRALDPSALVTALYVSNKDEALEIAREMRRKKHRDMYKRYVIGDALYHKGDYDGAIEYYTRPRSSIPTLRMPT